MIFLNRSIETYLYRLLFIGQTLPLFPSSVYTKSLDAQGIGDLPSFVLGSGARSLAFSNTTSIFLILIVYDVVPGQSFARSSSYRARAGLVNVHISLIVNLLYSW